MRVLLAIAAILISYSAIAQRFWVATTPSNWNNAANWSLTSGGAGGATPPGAADLAVFDGAAGSNGNCNLDIAPTVAGITISGYGGTIDLLGFNLTTTGTNTFTTGTITNTGAAAAVTLNTVATTTFNGTLLNADISGSTGSLLFNGSTFNGTVNVSKTDNSNDNSTGNNIFNGTTTITNLGGGQVLLGNGNPDQFNGATTFNNNGSYRFYLAHNHAGQTTTFGSSLTLNTNKSGGTDAWSFFVAESSDTNVSFGGTVTINCAGTLRSNHRFLQGANSTAVYTGTLTVNVTNTESNTSISLGTNGTSTYNGDIVVSNTGGASGIFFNTTASASSTLAATRTISIGGAGFTDGTLRLSRFAQTGATTQTLTTLTGTARLDLGPSSSFGGDVVFTAPRLFLDGMTVAGTATLEKTGASDDSGDGGNVFNGVTTITNTGSGYLMTGNGNSDQFNAVTTFNNNGTYRIYFAHNHGTQTTTFASDVFINSNKTSGDNFSYLVAEGADTNVSFGGNVTINCAGSSRSDHRFLNGNGSTALFGATTTINITNTDASTQIIMGQNGTTTYNGNIVVSNASTSGITFNNTASATSTLNGAISISGSYANGSLNLYRFDQVGAVANNLTLTADAILRVGPDSEFDGDVTFIAPQVFLNGCIYQSAAAIEKTGATNNAGTGGNTFNDIATITNSGTGDLRSGSTNPDIFNSSLTVNNTGSSLIYLAHNSAGNQFNGDITLNSTSGSGIRFSDAAGGSSTMSAGNTISIGGSGFTSGDLYLEDFTQLGAVGMVLNLGATASSFRIGPGSTFGGPVSFSAPRLFLEGATFNQNAYLEKTGANNDTSTGNSTFVGDATIVNNGTGELRMQGGNTFGGNTIITNNATRDILLEFSVGSTYNGDVTFNNTGTSNVRVAYGGATAFNGNIVVNSTNGNGIYFCENTGTATLADTRTISIGGLGFSSGSLRLDQFTQIGSTAQFLTLTNGTLLRIGNSSQFNGGVNFIAPQLELNGCTYNGNPTYLEKNGATNNNSTGGNTFNGLNTSIVNSGSGYLLTANTNPDIFNGPLTVTNSGSNWIYLAHNSAGNEFNNTVDLNNNGSGLGILFSNAGGGSSTLGVGGSLDIGMLGFSTGTLRIQSMTQAVGGSPQAMTLTGDALLQLGPSTTFNADVDFESPRLLLNGTTYNGVAQLEKTGTTNDDGTGGNTFSQTAIITNSGDSYLLSANTSPDVFDGTLILVNQGASTIRMANNSPGNQFNGNIELNSLAGGGLYFCNGANGTATLAATRTIGVGGFGVVSGDVRLLRFTQIGATAQALSLSGIAILTLGPSSAFGGDVNFSAPRLLLNGTDFSGITVLEKNGAVNDVGNGGNNFAAATTIINSGSGYLLTANTSRDTFNGSLTVTNTGSNIIYLAHATAGNEFNGDITFNSTLGSGGVYFANNAGADAQLGNLASLLTGGLGFSSGELRFRRFTQVGAAPQTLLLTGTALLRLGPNSQFNGNLDFRAPQLELDGCIFNGTTYLEKTGATNDDSDGGNFFNGPTTIVNSGTGWIRTGLTGLDTFDGDLTLTNTGSSVIRMADNIPGTVFNGNLVVNSTFGQGIYFSASANGTSTLAAGRTITVGGTGFTDGELRLTRFTQLGATAQALTLTGTALLRVGPSSIFNGNVNFAAPQLLLDGATYNGTATLQKTGATGNQGAGNNVFYSTANITNSGSGVLRTNGNNTFVGTTTITNSGSADLLLELNTGSTYNGDVTFTNTGTSNVRVAYRGATSFNGNIIVNSTNGNGIYFSENAAGSGTLATGRTLAVGGTGFSDGELRLERFTQVGATAQTITLTGTSIFRTNNTATFNGNTTVSAPRIFLQNSIFNGTASFTKTDANTDSNFGGNTFNGTSTFVNTGAGTFRLSNNASDTYVGNATFNQIAGNIQPAYNQPGFFEGNVTVDGASPITFGANNGTATFSGGNAQAVNRIGAASPIFRRMAMNKSANSVTLNTPVSVTTNATFTAGILNTDATNILSIADNATVTGGSNASHVDGPVLKIGNDSFIFPTGDNGIYRSIAISAPSSTVHTFTAEYFFTPQAFGGIPTYDPSFFSVSACEYWTLERTPVIAGSNVSVTLSWNSADCVGPYISDPSTLRVARWSGTAWVSHGNGGTTGTSATGTIISSGAVTSFSPFTLASTTSANPLPVELIEFVAIPLGSSVGLKWSTLSELNNDFFAIERSADGIEFSEIGLMPGAGTTTVRQDYIYEDVRPLTGVSYYRLRQTDFDGTVSFSNIARIDRESPDYLIVSPNPISQSSVATTNFKGDFVLLNSLGQVVLKIQESDELNTKGLATGVYLLKSSNGTFTRLVIE